MTKDTHERLLIVVRTVNTIAQAEVLKGLLAANGVPVLLAYESAVALQANLVGSAAPVDLLVPATQATEAREILDRFYTGRLEHDSV